MISEKKQEITQQINRIDDDIISLNKDLVKLTNNFITQLSISYNLNIDGISITKNAGFITVNSKSTTICNIVFYDNDIDNFNFYNIGLYVGDKFKNCEQHFDVMQMLYKAVKDKNNIYLDYKNQISEILLKISSKKQFYDVLHWAHQLIIDFEKEIKQDEIFYKGYCFSEFSKCVKSFNHHQEIYVYGLNFSKNPTGTYSIQLLDHDKSIKTQSTRASEEVLMNLIKSFV
jgi:hypothetical protein